MRLAAVVAAASIATGALADTAPPGRAKSQACQPCHGPIGVSLAPDAPHLAGQPQAYLVQQLKAFRSGKRAHEVMNVVAKPLTDADIEELAAWYASIAVEARERR